MRTGECDSCGRFGPLTNRGGYGTEGSFCPSCCNHSPINQGDHWSEAYAELHDDAERLRKLLGEARGATAVAREAERLCHKLADEKWVKPTLSKMARLFNAVGGMGCKPAALLARIDAEVE